MAAPKGNKFWQARSSHGRKPIFETPEALWDAAVEYFEWNEKNPLQAAELVRYLGKASVKRVPKMRPMTLDGLYLFLGISPKTWYNYVENKDFLHVTQQIERVIRVQKFEGAAADLLNHQIIARDLGLIDKAELNHKGNIAIIDGDDKQL